MQEFHFRENRPLRSCSVLSRRIRKERKQEKLTQDELAQRLSVSKKTIANMEREDVGTVSFRTVLRALSELGLEVYIKKRKQIDANDIEKMAWERQRNGGHLDENIDYFRQQQSRSDVI